MKGCVLQLIASTTEEGGPTQTGTLATAFRRRGQRQGRRSRVNGSGAPPGCRKWRWRVVESRLRLPSVETCRDVSLRIVCGI